MHHALLMSDLPPVPQQGEQVFGQHGIAILSTLAAFDPDQHTFAIDVANLEHRYLRDTKACAIADRQGRLVLETGGRVEETGYFVPAQNDRELAPALHPHQLARQIRPVDRVGEEKPQRRHDAVHGRHRNASFALLDLEPMQVFGCGRVGRATEIGRETSYIADVVALRLHGEMAQVHVFDQPLAQPADRGNGCNFGHRLVPSG